MTFDPWTLPAGFAARAVEGELGRRVVEVVELRGVGLVNAVFRVETTQGVVVVRARPDDYVDRYRQETHCQQRAHEHGIPTGRTLAIGRDDDGSYQIESFIPGVNASTLDALPLWRRIGELARRVNDIPYAPATLFKDPEPFIRRYARYNLDCLRDDDPLLGLGILTLAHHDQLRPRFERLLTQPFRHGLCHADLSPRNVLVTADDVAVLIDWGNASYYPVPHWELSELRIGAVANANPAPSAIAAFLDGYSLTRTDLAEIEEQVQDIMLVRSIDLVRWAIDRSPVDLARVAWSARRVIAALLGAQLPGA